LFCIICCNGRGRKEICDFLKSFPSQYVSQGNPAGAPEGKWRFREDPKWALPDFAAHGPKDVIWNRMPAALPPRQRIRTRKSAGFRRSSRELSNAALAGADGGEIREIEDPDDPNPM